MSSRSGSVSLPNVPSAPKEAAVTTLTGDAALRVTKTELDLQKQFLIVTPTQQIQVKHVEEVLGSPLHNLLPDEIIQMFKKKHKCETLDPEMFLDGLSFKKLGKRLKQSLQLVQENHFQNLAETYEATVAESAHPRTVEELQQVVNGAIQHNRRIRVVGAGHSWNPVFPEDGAVMVSMEHFKGIEKDVTGSEENWSITIQAGTTIREVNDYLLEHNLALPTNVIMDHVGFGGLVTMSCHGTGWNEGTISDLCIAMSLVDGQGQVRHFSLKENGARVWSALAVNLGLFGIVFEMKLKVVKMFHVEVVDMKADMNKLFLEGQGEEIRKIVTSYHSSQFFWMPFNDKCWVKTFQVTSKEVSKPPCQYVVETFSNWLSMNFGFVGADMITKLSPLTPLFLKTGFVGIPEEIRVEKITHAIHWEKFLDAIRIDCSEFAFPIRSNNKEDWANVVKAWYVVVNKVKEYEEKLKYPLNLTAEMRFIAHSNALLSPAYGNEHTCFMEIVTNVQTPGIVGDRVHLSIENYKQFSCEVMAEWMKIPGARPHWAKMEYHVPGIETHIRKEYAQNIQEFIAIRKELNVDPNDIFYTNWLGSILEPDRFRYTSNQKKKEGGCCVLM